MVEKGSTLSTKLCAVQCIFHVQNTKQKYTKYKNYLCKVARSWISGGWNSTTSSSDELQFPDKKPTPRGPKQDHPGRLSGDFSKHKLDKIVAGGEDKKKYTARQCKVCAAHKK
jgi:hypothetical protein